MKISVIIPTLNRPEILNETLDSILKQSILPSEVVIIDQSDDELTERVCRRYPIVRYLHISEKSSTHARNKGIKESNGEILVFLDDDVSLLPGYFENALNGFQIKPEAAAFCGNLINMPSFGQLGNYLRKFFLFDYSSENMKFLPNFQATNFKKYPETIEEVSWVNGCNFCVKKEKLQNCLFDENLIMYALAEDRDFSYQLSKTRKIFFNPSMKLIHKVVNMSRLPSKKKVFMVYVHQMYLTKKNFGWKSKNRIAYWWNISGRIIFSLFSCCSFKKSSFLNLKYNSLAFLFVLNNKKNILNGDLKKFHVFLKK